jgi:DNA-binding NarL/FixJ family response regulator
MGQNGHVRVVIVDDYPYFREAARECLNARGYDVVAEADCAAAAVKAVAHHQPNAMLLDIRLGDDDGFAVCEAVTCIRPEIAVILTSAEATPENVRERVEACGARGFVRKEHLPRVDFAEFWQSA